MPKPLTTIEPGWFHKERAAAHIGVSIRQLENLAALGRVRKNRLPRQSNERSARVLYSLEDLDAIKAGKPNITAPVPPPAPKAIAPANGDAALAAQLAQLARAFPAPARVKPWLTLHEAADYSGLPAAFLLAQARAGAAFALNVAQGTKAHWRFNRAGLREITR